jgi:hypothetical protein
MKYYQIIENIALQLKQMEVDGESMEYLIRKVGMEEQMLRQLMLTMPIEQVEHLMSERKELDGQN